MPVVAHRLEPGDVILTDKDGQMHVGRNQATHRRVLTDVQVDSDAGQRLRVHLTDTDGKQWIAWPTDVAWLLVGVTA